MCKFKDCKVLGKCFLEKSSPCPDHIAGVPKNIIVRKNRIRSRLSRPRYAGFLDPEFVDALYRGDEIR